MGDAGEKLKENCPTCGSSALREFVPFCSRRCAEIDLGRWFKGSFVIPGGPLGEDDTDLD